MKYEGIARMPAKKQKSKKAKKPNRMRSKHRFADATTKAKAKNLSRQSHHQRKQKKTNSIANAPPAKRQKNQTLDTSPHRPTLNLMVKLQDLDRTFAALADPTRRALLARLSERGDVSVSKLAEPFAMSLPAVMKHLDVLADAGLITRTKTGRTVACRLSAAPMEHAMSWLQRYQQFWSEALDQLATYVEEPSCPPAPVSRSSDTSRRPRKKSSVRGPTRSRS
ncbi:metalloregulator ArsR/SmtB family transcription factor [Paraburkholderia hospita]|uniref:ArsR/SmtB family transcription factor n=1 Tax=Paraburkholderia hospita TaxID=169430 RepID=UPI002ADD5041|nr:metalloregulator ArsR/SmtB family transcription factor [Paraburkholderia hospita]